MCDHGYNIMFDSWKCEIKEEYLGRLVVRATRRTKNIYILDKVKIKRYINQSIETTQKNSKDNYKEEKDENKKIEKKGEIILSDLKIEFGSNSHS